ncbi:hypothetical protein ACVDG3_14300 [Meridianimarinicoccus sp. RP-17]|uniref:hypothetical protein n=1 Tax=Meridianimarinicoccus zhengii TaxID=2056810 RepID=UPI000DAB9229|nr:hypothetical protein [Phycocomes zhengii]
MTQPDDTDRFLRRFVVITVICVSSIIALVVIVATALTPYTDYAAPPVLENWGGLIIGFYFGTFVGLLKDWLSPRKPEPDAPEPTTTKPEQAP